jgi:hypothetical protein
VPAWAAVTTSLATRRRDDDPTLIRRLLLFLVHSENPTSRPIDKVQLRARQASHGLVAVLFGRHFVSRPALDQLTRVRATIEKSSHHLLNGASTAAFLALTQTAGLRWLSARRIVPERLATGGVKASSASRRLSLCLRGGVGRVQAKA